MTWRIVLATLEVTPVPLQVSKLPVFAARNANLMISTICMFLFVIAATITDVTRQKIYNGTTYTGIVVALVLAGIVTAAEIEWVSEIGIWTSVFGLLSCFAIMLICFVLFQVGGGDVKLLAMVGAFFGPQLGIEALLWTFVLGGASALIILIWRIGFLKLIKRIWHQLMVRLGVGNWDPLSEEEVKQMGSGLYLAPSTLMAVAIVKFSLIEKLMNINF